MTGSEIKEKCAEMNECESCPIKRVCEKFKEDYRKAEPWELDELMKKNYER